MSSEMQKNRMKNNEIPRLLVPSSEHDNSNERSGLNEVSYTGPV